ncbi:MAG TPA: DUF4129 domain-containing protein [Solirubrobacteraceae bacterium]|nr:DUF4129 domain-containing protein [Solirubrobacteraceae bacterium]
MHKSSSRLSAAVATLGLAGVVAVVAMAARSPLSRSTPVNASSAQAPTTALFTVLAGVGIVMLGAFAAVIWSGRRRKDDPPEPEPTRIEASWIAKLVAILLPLALGAALVAAAAVGSRRTRSGPSFGGGGLGLSPLHRSTSGVRSGGFVVPSWLPWTALGIVSLAIVAGLVVLWLARARPSGEGGGSGAASAALEAAIDALDADSDPRRAVIAAYGAMQRTLGQQGVGRLPAEAPREYLRRVLLERGATEREATTLTGLFEEARYSTHPIPERVREVALSALRSLRGRLQAEGVQ